MFNVVVEMVAARWGCRPRDGGENWGKRKGECDVDRGAVDDVSTDVSTKSREGRGRRERARELEEKKRKRTEKSEILIRLMISNQTRLANVFEGRTCAAELPLVA